MKLAFKSVAAIALIGFGLLVLRPSRNIIGDPSLETLKQSCTIPNSSSQIKLYEGSGDRDALYWYTVTLEEPNQPERQVYFTYGFPEITAISCENQAISITLESPNNRLRRFTLDELRALRNQPKGFDNRIPEHSTLEQQRIKTPEHQIVRRIFGMLCLLGGGLLLWSISRQLIEMRETP